MKLEDLRLAASVLSADGHKLGTLSRFVFNKNTLKLTHIVVDTGILRSGEPLWKGGWGLSHDRVLPFGVLDRASHDELRITMTADEFRELSVDYIQEHFERMPDEKPGWPDASDIPAVLASMPGEPGPYLLNVKVTPFENVYPMVPAGGAVNEMVLGPPQPVEVA